jgi:HEAT repeat protein
VFTEESIPDIKRQASAMLLHCATAFVLFGEYALATWAFGCMKKMIPDNRSYPMDAQGKWVEPDKMLDTKILATVMDDLKSEDRTRQQDAYQLLGSMGQMVIPQLIDMMKREDNLRARQLAAELVKSSGQTGINLLKKALMGENRPDERARILDVVDSVTKDVMAELTDTISDTRDVVRKAAFRLAERLNTTEVLQMMIECSKSSDATLAVYAISSATKLKPAAARETIVGILKKSDNPDVLVAACRAMGQINDPSGIAPLLKILTRRRFLGARKYDTQVRVAAAYALAQIPGQQAQKALNAAAKDPDYRVRETVKQAMTKKG